MWWRGALSRHGKTFGAATAASVAGVGAFATVSEQTHIKTTEAQGPTVVGMLQEIANGVSRMEATLGNLKDASPSSFAAPKKGSKQGIDVVLGAQWGDEGKGKLVDMLSQVSYSHICFVT